MDQSTLFISHFENTDKFQTFKYHLMVGHVQFKFMLFYRTLNTPGQINDFSMKTWGSHRNLDRFIVVSKHEENVCEYQKARVLMKYSR